MVIMVVEEESIDGGRSPPLKVLEANDEVLHEIDSKALNYSRFSFLEPRATST